MACPLFFSRTSHLARPHPGHVLAATFKQPPDVIALAKLGRKSEQAIAFPLLVLNPPRPGTGRGRRRPPHTSPLTAAARAYRVRTHHASRSPVLSPHIPLPLLASAKATRGTPSAGSLSACSVLDAIRAFVLHWGGPVPHPTHDSPTTGSSRAYPCVTGGGGSPRRAKETLPPPPPSDILSLAG
jgi:hypothetical protein